MLYRNKVTGALVDSASVISGGNWESVEPTPKKDAVKAEQKTDKPKPAPKKEK